MTDFIRQDTSQDIYISRDNDDYLITYPDGFKLDVPAEVMAAEGFNFLCGIFARLTPEHAVATELREDWEVNVI